MPKFSRNQLLGVSFHPCSYTTASNAVATVATSNDTAQSTPTGFRGKITKMS